ncbi:MAG: hypothetical protein ACRDA0_10715 [Cetobacterium sp.]|uniref:hypothetical protein n=1 Tax=Cetobacterium sp. TaxID=2071632 RepID=UPI003F2C6A32
MKKILLMMLLTGSISMANNKCLVKDYPNLIKEVKEAKKLKDDKSPMAQMKYKKMVIQIVKSVAHIKETHYKDLDKKQQSEIIEISNTFAR